MRSIRTFLLTRVVGGTALVLIGAALSLGLVVQASIEDQFDRNLVDRVQGLSSILFQVGDELEFEFSDELMPEYDEQELSSYFILWHEDGSVLEASNSMRGGTLELASKPTRTPVFWDGDLPDGRRGRFVAQEIEVHHVYPEEGPDRPRAKSVVITVARGTEELTSAVVRVWKKSAWISLLLLALIGGVTWGAVERGLAPARRLAQALGEVQADDLPDVLAVGSLPSELTPIADKANLLMGRVSRALERERRTTADIAHELRTPISEMLTVSEVALRDRRVQGEALGALGTVRDVASRMGRSVSTLLKLARIEMGAESIGAREVDLGALLAAQLEQRGESARERDLRLCNRVEAGARVLADHDALEIILSNLVGNALHYAPTGTTVRCWLDDRAEGWTLSIENVAEGLDVGDLETLTEPFWRKDHARADRDRSGLGLALSLALADKAGMRLSFELEEGLFRARLGRQTATNGNGHAP